MDCTGQEKKKEGGISAILNTLVRQDSDLLLVSEPMGGKH